MAFALAIFLAGCGAAPPSAASMPPRLIDELRARAARNPNDADAARELAIGEMLEDGGDPARARPAIDRALELGEGDVTLLFVSSIEHEQHGRMAQAFEAELAALEAAPRSSSPLAPAIAEILVGYARGRETDVRDVRARIQPVLARLVESPGRAGLPARLSAAWTLARLHGQRGEPDQAHAAYTRAGCIQEVRAAGPFGPHPMLAFDRPIAAEGRGALGERYPLGPGREEQPTQTLETRGCGFDLADELEESREAPGVWVVETNVQAPSAGRYALYVETPNPFRIAVDGARAGGLDRRTETGPSGVFFPLELTAGAHEIEIVIASRHASPYVSLAFARSDASFVAEAGAAIPDGDELLTRFLGVLLARVRGDTVGARERLLAARGTTATWTITEADVLLDEPFMPDEQRDDQARRLLERAASSDPGAWYPRYRAALTEQGERESFELLRGTVEQHAEIPSLWLALARRLRQRGRASEADLAIGRARTLVPSCEALEAELGALRSRGRVEEADARVGELEACDARSEARLAMLERQRRWTEVAAEIDRLAPLLDEADLREMRLELALATDDRPNVRRLREEIARANGSTFEEVFPIIGADDLLARGDRTRALASLAASIDRHPNRSGGLRRAHRALGGADPLLRHRVDGAEAIRRFEASGRRYEDASHVLVLDYMVVRVRDDGSSEELVHQIYRVQSEEAIEELGQLSLPGYVLTLRTIKPDGRRVEPDQIEELDHVELPGLAVGDYVEYEFVRGNGPLDNGGYRSGGWVFQNFSVPFDLSRIVVLVPDGIPLEIEARGPVPAPVETRDGALRVMTWTVEQSRPLTPEPNSAVSPERLPSLDFGVRAGWDDYLDAGIDALADGDPRDPAAERLVREVLGERADAALEERVRHLHRWVLENIEDGDGDAPAPLQLAARAGERTRVLRYMLALAGIDARIVLVRALGDRSPGQIFRGDVYRASLVMVRAPGRPPIVTSVADRGIPFGYIAPNLRGQTGVVMEPGHPTITLADQGSSDLHEVSVDVTLAPDGSARVSVEERFHGLGSYFWRGQLEDVPEAELRERFERGYVAPMFGASRLVSLEILGREDVDAPLVLRYVADVAMLGRRVRGGQLFPPMFRSGLTRPYASLATRETTQAISGAHMRVRTTVRSPNASLPADGRASGPHGARATFRSRRAGGAVVLESEVLVPPMLVTPAEYAAFAEFCRDVDRLEAREITVSAR